MKVYDVIRAAKDVYTDEVAKRQYPGMCWCLKVAAVKGMDFKEKNKKGHPSYKDLHDNIPEFNPGFLHHDRVIRSPGLDFWWDTYNVKARFDAFEILESIYKDSVREFEY